MDTRAGTLVSVNVGLPRDVAWRGQTVHTGVWKHPVDGRRRVRRGNIDGDGQGDLAGHGGEQRAVLVYQLNSYRHWRVELGRDDLSPGVFGENFTVDGLRDDQVCIGDRYRVGTALFEVTNPASPATGSGSGWMNRAFRRCWSPTTVPGSTCGCSRKVTSAPETRSNWSRQGRPG